MTSIIGKVIKTGIKYTQNGCRLLSKQRYAPNIMPHNLIPKGCKSLEIVNVETHFGEGLSKVVTFFDENNNMLKKILTKQVNNEQSKFVREYSRNIDELGQNVLFTSSKNYKNEELVNKYKESFFAYTLPDGKTKAMKRTKLKITPNSGGNRSEWQLYEDRSPFKRDYIETKAIRYKDGHVGNKSISGNISGLEELQKDPYLYIRNYDFEEFARSASWYAQLKQKVLGMSGEFRVAELPDAKKGVYQHGYRRVTVDSDKCGFVNEVVRTINHEYRHKYQHSLMDRLESFWNIFKRPEPLSANEEIFAKKLKRAKVNYCQPEENYEKYYSNFMEVDARKAGDEAALEYQNYSRKLAKIFSMPECMTHTQCPDDVFKKFLDKSVPKNFQKKLKIAANANS